MLHLVLVKCCFMNCCCLVRHMYTFTHRHTDIWEHDIKLVYAGSQELEVYVTANELVINSSQKRSNGPLPQLNKSKLVFAVVLVSYLTLIEVLTHKHSWIQSSVSRLFRHTLHLPIPSNVPLELLTCCKNVIFLYSQLFVYTFPTYLS